MTQKQDNQAKGGIVGAIAILFGGLMALFSLLSVLNTAFGWEATVKGTPLPKHWDATLGLIGATVIFWAIWAFLTYVPPVRRFGRNHPWILAMIVVAGLVGAIVGITIWDNANIAARNAKWAEEARQDSLRVVDSLARVLVENPGDTAK
jgi:hypothetical protein